MDTTGPRTAATPAAVPDHARGAAAFRTVKQLVAGYLGLSVLALAAVAVLHSHRSLVNAAVWDRGSIVVASAVVTYACAVRAARGSRAAYRRLRIICALMTAAIVVIIALPGDFPLWMKLEQSACGVLLAAVLVLIHSGPVRELFTEKG